MTAVAVIGAGLMGSGIAQVAAQAGFDVHLRDVDDESIERGLTGIDKSLARFVAKDRLSETEAAEARARIKGTTSLADAVADTEVVVEAIFENLEIKTELFQELDKYAPAGAVLATNIFLP